MLVAEFVSSAVSFAMPIGDAVLATVSFVVSIGNAVLVTVGFVLPVGEVVLAVVSFALSDFGLASAPVGVVLIVVDVVFPTVLCSVPNEKARKDGPSI